MSKGFLDSDNYKRFKDLVGILEPETIKDIGPLGLSDLLGAAPLYFERSHTIRQITNSLVDDIKRLNSYHFNKRTRPFAYISTPPTIAGISSNAIALSKLLDEENARIKAEQNPVKMNSFFQFVSAHKVVTVIIALLGVIATAIGAIPSLQKYIDSKLAPYLPTEKASPAVQAPLNNK